MEATFIPKTANLRMTRQRKLILEELRRANTHPSADELYERVRRLLPRISLATVYRNLEVLSDLKEIQTLELSGSLKRFDGNPKNHYHIRCVRCGRVDDAPIAPLAQLEDELYGSTVFTIIGHRLEFVGMCPSCSRQMASNIPGTLGNATPDDPAIGLDALMPSVRASK